jgi:hypothetical protein
LLLELPESEKVSTIDVRQRIGDMLNRVALRRDEFVIERKGKGAGRARADRATRADAEFRTPAGP